ncbi:Uu.00g146640.m01.CDS01 [Anthostomella pinea]|uniref:Uu.00g146640.m01.CDS01 n=1 Tax=Anthostomella pinea TaxID=933095 RepID=A0AAI8VRB6_9PEZI|nr:Uu.00g146640.m01.CDS01 [Anthostomella pinea]
MYATVSDSGSMRPPDDSPHHGWPSSPHPTPYEIFGQKKTAAYSKAKFYELVKVYHPDRHRISTGPLVSQTVRLERYRLVVSANEILSDPVKRRAYDLYGAGWGGKLSMDNARRATDKSWRDEPGNPSMNATWEDWERWYGEREGAKKKQHPLYMSNELFVGVLCAFVLVGSLGQARRASTNTMNIVEMREQKHAAISQDMRNRQGQQAVLNRHERVESFLRQRDGWDVASSVSSQPASASAGK